MVASAVASIQGEAIDSTVDAVQPADHDVSIDVTPIIAEAETTTLDDISSDVVVDQPQMTSRIVQIIDEKTGETVQTYTLNMPQASDQLIPTSEGMDETVVIEDPNNSLISGLLNAADGQSMVLADQNPPSEAPLQTITIPISTSGESGEQVEYVSLPGMSDGQEVIAYEAQVGDGGEEGVEYVFILWKVSILMPACVNSLSLSDVYIYISKLDHHWFRYSSAPVRRQAIIWTNAGLMLIISLGTNWYEISINTQLFKQENWFVNISRRCGCDLRLVMFRPT